MTTNFASGERILGGLVGHIDDRTLPGLDGNPLSDAVEENANGDEAPDDGSSKDDTLSRWVPFLPPDIPSFCCH